MNILADASLPGLEKAFPEPFCLTTYSKAEQIPNALAGQDVLLCRANLKVTKDLLKKHSLTCIATASSGKDHLDLEYLQTAGIKVLDAKGANAHAVADYVLATLAYLDKQQLINGNKAAVIGMGKVGTEVAHQLQRLDFSIQSYDPLKAATEKDFQSTTLEHVYQSDILCIHAELHHNDPFPSYNLINHAFLKQLKPGCVLINAARGGIVNEQDVLDADSSLVYCTDVYLNEPNISKQIIEKATLCTPHIAGHSIEAKHAAVAMLSEQLHKMAGLAVPQFTVPKPEKSIEAVGSSWQDRILSLYNPLDETTLLKQAQDLAASFISVRRNHNFRHDFPQI